MKNYTKRDEADQVCKHIPALNKVQLDFMACRLNIFVLSKTVFKIFFPYLSFITPSHSIPGEPDKKLDWGLKHVIK